MHFVKGLHIYVFFFIFLKTAHIFRWYLLIYFNRIFLFSWLLLWWYTLLQRNPFVLSNFYLRSRGETWRTIFNEQNLYYSHFLPFLHLSSQATFSTSEMKNIGKVVQVVEKNNPKSLQLLLQVYWKFANYIY